MGRETGIPWCDHTFNGWIGCAKKSPGCLNCYAEVDTPARVSRGGGVELWGPNAARRIKADSGWDEPIRWDRSAAAQGVRRRVFSLSQGDVFEDRDDLVDARERLFATIQATPNLDWLLLTKRPENADRLASEALGWDVGDHGFPPNVWLGISAEDQKHFDERWGEILPLPCSVRWVSYEPALGPLSLRGWGADVPDWIVCGGESHRDPSKARPFDVGWARSLLAECGAAGVAFYMKQFGAIPITSDPVRDSRLGIHAPTSRNMPGYFGCCFIHDITHGANVADWPEGLNVREFPTPREVYT